MKKTKKKLLITAVTTMLACTLSAGLVMTASADEAAKDHEFDDRNGDSVFEDFDRANLTPIVDTTTPEKTVLGVKPYLHVEYTAENGGNVGQIYKQGSATLAGLQKGGVLTIRMRAPQGDATLSELNLGIRGADHDKDDQVVSMGFDELKDKGGVALTELTTDWKTYEISVVMSYTDKTYGTGEGAVDVVGDTAENAVAIHIFADDGESGTVDIEYVSFGTNVLNTFMGGSNLKEMAQATDGPATWWADSIEGRVEKRMPTLKKDGEMTVVKESAVGNYKYAIIETEGDISGLKVAATTDGTTFGTAAAYDGYSVALSGQEKGFKLVNEGDEEVKIKRIYLTNLEVIVPDTATPVIDAKTAEFLDDFSVAQSGFTNVYADMAAAPEAAEANMYFRMSYANGDKVSVKDGALVMEAAASGHTNFIFNSKTLHTQKYVVLKMKLEGEGANLDKFRFKLIGANDEMTGDIWSHAFKSGVEYKSKLLEESNPYKDGDWHYVIVDIAESGFKQLETGYSGMDLYYEGTGKLYIDEIFFADGIDYAMTVSQNVEGEKVLAAATDYAYEYLGAPNADGYKTLCFDITPAAEGFNISELRLGFGRADESIIGTRWASQNSDGMLYTRDGKMLSELTYTAGVATHIEIDLEASGITEAYSHIHLHRSNIGAFTLNNIEYKTYEKIAEMKKLDTENAVTAEDKAKFTPEKEGYEEALRYSEVFASKSYGKMAFTLTPGAGFSIDAFRFTGPCEYWFAQHADVVITDDGKKVGEITFTENTPINIVLDLAQIGGTAVLAEDVVFHTAGVSTGAFTVTNLTLTPYKDVIDDYYAEALDKLPLYLDNVKPTVSITNELFAKVGDEITVAYTANDNAATTADLTVEVTVTKDGNEVTLTDGKFTAEEGTYTVTVKVTDVAGNEATDVKQITVEGKQRPAPAPTDDGKLSAGAIAGIVIGCVAGVGLIVGGVLLALHFRKKKKNADSDKKDNNDNQENS